jgi:hypothetical protein
VLAAVPPPTVAPRQNAMPTGAPVPAGAWPGR